MDSSLEAKPRVCFEFEVEKVIGVSDDGRYLVKWAPGWVSRFHLVGCEHLIQEFLTQQSEMEIGPTNDVHPEIPPMPSTAQDNGSEENSKLVAEQQLNSQTLSLEPKTFEIKTEDKDETEKCTYIQTALENLPGLTCITPVEENTSKEPHSRKESQKSSTQDTTPAIDLFLKYQSDILLSETCASSSSPNQNQTRTLHTEQDDLVIFCSNPVAPGHKCNICEETFSHEDNLKVHIKTHDSEDKQHTCPYCEKKFRVKCNLNTHLRTHTGEQPYSCAYCDYTCSFQGNLKVHMRIHTGEKPYCCELCGKTFTQSGTRNKHIARCARAKKHDNA